MTQHGVRLRSNPIEYRFCVAFGYHPLGDLYANRAKKKKNKKSIKKTYAEIYVIIIGYFIGRRAIFVFKRRNEEDICSYRLVFYYNF